MLKICYSFLYFVWADCIICSSIIGGSKKSKETCRKPTRKKKVKLQKGIVCTEQGQDLELCNR